MESQQPRLLSLLGLTGQLDAPPVSAGAPLRTRDELFAIWSVARAEANIAYDAWRDARDRETYLVYRAAEDRADAAQDALAGTSTAFPRAA